MSLTIFRFYPGNDSLMTIKKTGSAENMHSSVNLLRGADALKIILIARQFLKAKKPL